MRLVLFEGPGRRAWYPPGVWTDDGVVDVSSVTNNAFDAITPQQVMEGSSTTSTTSSRSSSTSSSTRCPCRSNRAPAAAAAPPGQDHLRHRQLLGARPARPAAAEHVLQEPGRRHRPRRHHRPARIRREEDVRRRSRPYVFQHEAELGIVTRGPSKSVSRDNWRQAVFGYTGMIDVSARLEGRSTWRSVSWMGKSFDTFAPVGPCITTADEITNPNDIRVRFFNNGELTTTTRPTTWSTRSRRSSSSSAAS